MAGPFRTPQKYTFHTELRGARGVITNLNAISRALDVTRLAATKTFQLDRQIRMLSVQMGAAAGEATNLAQASLGLASATGASVDTTTKLINAYQRAGQSMSKLTGGATATTNVFNSMTAAQQRSMRAQTNLVDLFGMSADEVLGLTKRTSHLGLSMDDLLGATAEFQAKFKMPGMMQQMGKVTAFAESAVTRFSTSVTGGTEAVLTATMRTGTIFAKTYGIDIAKAIEKASKQQEHFMKQAQKDTDVFLGLSDTFDQMTMSLFEAGLQFEDIQQLTRLGQQDPLKYAESMRQLYETLGEETTMQGRRLMRQLQMFGDEETVRLIRHPAMLKAGLEQREMLKDLNKFVKIDEAGLESYEDLTKSLRSIGAVALTMVQNLTGLFKTIVGSAFAGALSKAFKGAVPILQRFNKVISDITNQFIGSEFWDNAEDYFIGIGKVLAGVSAAAGVLASAFAATIIPFKLIISAIRIIPLIGKPAAAGVSGLSKSLFSFAKSAVESISVVAGLGIAFNDFGEALKVPQKGSTLVIRGFRAMALGIVETFDGVLGGIPTWIAKKFFPEMRGTIGDNVKIMFQEFQLWVEKGVTDVTDGWWAVFKNQISGKMAGLRLHLITQWSLLERSAIEWGGNIGRAIGTLAKWAWDAISPLFKRETWSGGWQEVLDYFNGDGKSGLGDSFDSIFRHVLALVKIFGKSFFDELLRPWGQGWLEAKSAFLDTWDSIRDAFSWLKNKGIPDAENMWRRFKVAAVESFFAIKNGGIDAFGKLAAYAKMTLGPLLFGANWLLESGREDARNETKARYDSANDELSEANLELQGATNTDEWTSATARVSAATKEFDKSYAAKMAAYNTLQDHYAAQRNYGGWFEEGSNDLKNVESASKSRRAADDKTMGTLLDPSRSGIKAYGQDYSGAPAKGEAPTRAYLARLHEEGVAKRSTDRAKRYSPDYYAKIMGREANRGSDTALNMLYAAQTRNAITPYLPKVASILKQINDYAKANPDKPGANYAYQQVKAAKGELMGAKTPEAAHDAWDKITSIIRNTASTRMSASIAEKAGFDPTTGKLPSKPAPAPQQAVGGSGGDEGQLSAVEQQKFLQIAATEYARIQKIHLDVALSFGSNVQDSLSEHVHVAVRASGAPGGGG